jgi:hypothetical protein
MLCLPKPTVELRPRLATVETQILRTKSNFAESAVLTQKPSCYSAYHSKFCLPIFITSQTFHCRFLLSHDPTYSSQNLLRYASTCPQSTLTAHFSPEARNCERWDRRCELSCDPSRRCLRDALVKPSSFPIAPRQTTSGRALLYLHP